jgi:hypothetical protein
VRKELGELSDGFMNPSVLRGRLLSLAGWAVTLTGRGGISHRGSGCVPPGKLHDWERDMSETTDVVDRQVAAYRDRDLERFLACYAADVKVKDFDGNVLMDGLEAMRGQYGPLFRDSPQLRADIPRRIVAGDYVIDEEYGSGIVMAGFPSEEHIAVVYRVRDGLIHDVVLLL